MDIPGYDIYEQLGRDGPATVYRARHITLDREVALKVIDTERVADPSLAERFVREARVCAGLSHPHILRVYDVNAHGSLNYIAMELARDGNLAAIIRGAMPQRTIHLLMRQMTAALDYAADKGYVHGDIGPGNILMRAPEDFVLAGFGIAEAAGASERTTRAGPPAGTPGYMSPEQAGGAVPDRRSDLYSLAVVCREMLTKQVPREADSAAGHLAGEAPRLPGELAVYRSFFDRGLARRPEDRFQSGGEMYRALAEVRDHCRDDEVLSGIRNEPRVTAPRRRRRGAGGTALAILALLLAGGGYYYWQHTGPGAAGALPAAGVPAAGVPAASDPAAGDPAVGEPAAAGDHAAAGGKSVSAPASGPDGEAARSELDEAVESLATSAAEAAAVGAFDRADSALAQALALAPDREDLAQRRAALPAQRAEWALARRIEAGQRLLAQGEFTGAAAQFRGALEQAPASAGARKGLAASAAGILKAARADAQRHRYDSAREKLAAALAWQPDNTGAAALQAELPALERAWRDEQAAIARREADADRRANSTVRAIADGDLGAARRHYTALSSEYPDMEVTRDVRRRLLAAYTAGVKKAIEVQSYDTAQALIDEGLVIAPELAVWARLREEVEVLEASDHRRLGAY
ncbi:protein kinase domain-containing protein [Parahaliea mediterranea]|uniref:Protein kinase n=1 Tax=Parahaliea mediterranea TaxID=651086 RepID=A0A939DCD8_9GAMM|nr:protein kinase [Parahaliea mediterranea]MBN7794992.1 protein kinase [Parahaliea mediterranea]